VALLIYQGGYAGGTVVFALALALRLRGQREDQERKLRESEANLERDVMARTAELEQRNDELGRAIAELMEAKQLADAAN
jgi:C4-dicarboxylate-specific signal transduction histidine kinase